MRRGDLPYRDTALAMEPIQALDRPVSWLPRRMVERSWCSQPYKCESQPQTAALASHATRAQSTPYSRQTPAPLPYSQPNLDSPPQETTRSVHTYASTIRPMRPYETWTEKYHGCEYRALNMRGIYSSACQLLPKHYVWRPTSAPSIQGQAGRRSSRELDHPTASQMPSECTTHTTWSHPGSLFSISTATESTYTWGPQLHTPPS